MDKQQHSPEPWRFIDSQWETEERDSDGDAIPFAGALILDDEGEPIDRLDMRKAGYDCWALDDANARRIVACVNACAGISTEALEQGKVSIREVMP